MSVHGIRHLSLQLGVESADFNDATNARTTAIHTNPRNDVSKFLFPFLSLSILCGLVLCESNINSSRHCHIMCSPMDVSLPETTPWQSERVWTNIIPLFNHSTICRWHSRSRMAVWLVSWSSSRWSSGRLWHEVGPSVIVCVEMEIVLSRRGHLETPISTHWKLNSRSYDS